MKSIDFEFVLPEFSRGRDKSSQKLVAQSVVLGYRIYIWLPLTFSLRSTLRHRILLLLRENEPSLRDYLPISRALAIKLAVKFKKNGTRIFAAD